MPLSPSARGLMAGRQPGSPESFAAATSPEAAAIREESWLWICSSRRRQTPGDKTRVFGISRVTPDSRKEKNAAKCVLAFGDPGNGFDMERMDGEKGRHEGTSPEGSGCFAEKL